MVDMKRVVALEKSIARSATNAGECPLAIMLLLANGNPIILGPFVDGHKGSSAQDQMVNVCREFLRHLTDPVKAVMIVFEATTRRLDNPSDEVRRSVMTGETVDMPNAVKEECLVMLTQFYDRELVRLTLYPATRDGDTLTLGEPTHSTDGSTGGPLGNNMQVFRLAKEWDLSFKDLFYSNERSA